MSNKEKTPKATAAEANSKEDKMEDLKNEMSVQERAGQVVVKVTFMFHDLELIGDGEDSVFFWATEEEYRKFEEYNKKPWAHYIGVMINLQMPEFLMRVANAVSDYATDVFISDIRLYDPDLDGDLVYEDGDLLYSEYDLMNDYYDGDFEDNEVND